MGWVISRNARKFLENLDERISRSEKVRRAMGLEEVVPFRALDVKIGKWRGFLRMRAGNIRIVFRIDYSNKFGFTMSTKGI